MRPIKFRCWSKRDKKFLFYMHLDEEGQHLDRDYAYVNKPMTWNQFTGLLDKNGVEIYEGDVLAYAQMGLQKDMSGDIRFVDGSFVIWAHKGLKNCTEGNKDFISIMSSDVYQKIGDIYQNPELVE